MPLYLNGVHIHDTLQVFFTKKNTNIRLKVYLNHCFNNLLFVYVYSRYYKFQYKLNLYKSQTAFKYMTYKFQ